MIVGASPLVRRALGPTTEFLRALPVIAVVPIAIVLLGFGDAMRIGVIAFGVFFPVFLATVDGVRRVSPEIRDTATLLHVGPVERSVRVHLPAALRLVNSLGYEEHIGDQSNCPRRSQFPAAAP